MGGAALVPTGDAGSEGPHRGLHPTANSPEGLPSEENCLMGAGHLWYPGEALELLSAPVRTSVQVMLGACWAWDEANSLVTSEFESAPATF